MQVNISVLQPHQNNENIGSHSFLYLIPDIWKVFGRYFLRIEQYYT